MIGKFFGGGRSGGGFAPGSSVFPDIDVDELAKDLGLVRSGAERGSENRPAADSEAFDSVEARIIDRVGALRRRGLNNYDDHLRVYASRLHRASDARARIDAEIGRAQTDMSAHITTWRLTLASGSPAP